MSNSELDLREIAFRQQEISKTLIQIAGELKGIREAIVLIVNAGTNVRGDSANSEPVSTDHVRRLEE